MSAVTTTGATRLTIAFRLNPRRETLRVAIGVVCNDLRQSNRQLTVLTDAELVELVRRTADLAEELGGWLLDETMDAPTAAGYLIVVSAKPREIRGVLGGAR